MSKNKIKKEEINDFDDLKELLLKNLSPQSKNNDGDGNNNVHIDINLEEDDSFSNNNEDTDFETKTYRKENKKGPTNKRDKKQEDVNDFDDLKGLLLKSLSEQNPQDNKVEDNIDKDSQENDPFLKDANEGLKLIQDKGEIDKSVQSLNNNLNKLLDSRKQRKKKHTIPSNQWSLLAVGIILLVAIIAYFLIHLNGIK